MASKTEENVVVSSALTSLKEGDHVGGGDGTPFTDARDLDWDEIVTFQIILRAAGRFGSTSRYHDGVLLVLVETHFDEGTERWAWLTPVKI